MQNRRTALFTLALVNFTHIVDSMIIMPLGDIFIELFDLTAGQFSFLVSAYALTAAFSSILAIFFLDTFDRKKALLFLYSGFSIGTFLCSFADSYISLVALRIVTGFFGGVIGALVLSVISDLYPFKERGTAMGALMMAFSAASALGVPIGLYLAAMSSWELPFLVIGGLGLLICAFIYLTFPSLRGHLEFVSKSRSFSNVIGPIFRDINQMNALIAGFFLVLGHFLIIPFISPYMIKNVGISQLEISYQFFAGGLATVMTSLFFGKMTDRYGVIPVFVILMFLSFIPTLLITHAGPMPLWLAIIYVATFFVFGSGRMIPPQTLISASAPVTTRGSFMSLKSALQQLAIAVASFVSGMIMFINEDGTFSNYNLVGYLAIVICLLTIVLVRRLTVAEGN